MMRLLSCLPLLLLAACANAGPEGDGAKLSGTSWRFAAIDGTVPAKPEAWLRFERDGISANVGCNTISGNWRIEGERLIAGPLIQTEMYCAGKVWGQEQSVTALLTSAPRFTARDGQLELRSSGHGARLERIDR